MKKKVELKIRLPRNTRNPRGILALALELVMEAVKLMEKK